MIDTKNKHDVVVAAVEALKKSEYKATAIKVELEANLERYDHANGGCRDCDNGRLTCENCNGYEFTDCGACEGRGVLECSICDGRGEAVNSDNLMLQCESCEGDGHNQCNDCFGTGNADCEECDGGHVDCVECGGDETESRDWGDTNVCHDFVLEQLVDCGLAEPIPTGEDYDYADTYRPKFPLVFSMFYDDHSVDSELTFTLALTDPEAVFLLPKVIDAFKALGEAVGGNMDTQGAGMHMALLNDPDCEYPTGYRSGDRGRFVNFRRSMQLLLPALYFLGSANETSRGLSYRQPMIEEEGFNGTKYFAINYTGGAVEFRIFDTCYDTPEAILDNLVVMGNCMKFWRSEYKNPKLDKITTRTVFGNDSNHELSRFYVAVEHVDLLNKGLQLLKPSYYAIGELKAQRKFKVTKRTVGSVINKRRKEATAEYKEYEQRFKWSVKVNRYDYAYTALDSLANRHGRDDVSPDDPEIQAQVEAEVERRIKDYEASKEEAESYIENRVRRYMEMSQGRYVLQA